METILVWAVTILNIHHAVSLKINVVEYCKLHCLNPQTVHTICEYRCAIASECVEYQDHPLSDDHRQHILDLHNLYRNHVASGHDTRGGNDAAKNMRALNYDQEIEVTTFCWGRRCFFGHDNCRHLPKYSSAGQNLFLLTSSTPFKPLDPNLLNTTLSSWYENIKYTNKEVLKNYKPAEEHPIGHYTQLVWATVEFVGCSRLTFQYPNETLKYAYYLICHYSPAGNFRGAPVYEFGQGCTYPLKPNKEYPALCGYTLQVGSKTQRTLDPDDKPKGVDKYLNTERKGYFAIGHNTKCNIEVLVIFYLLYEMFK